MNRIDLRALALLRLEEAKALLASGRPCGAYYLAGYAVECALKASIAKKTQQGDFPRSPEEAKNIYVHDFKKLIVAAGLKEELLNEEAASANFKRYWIIAVEWNESSRYDPSLTMAEATDLINAIEEPAEGIMQWLQRHW